MSIFVRADCRRAESMMVVGFWGIAFPDRSIWDTDILLINMVHR